MNNITRISHCLKEFKARTVSDKDLAPLNIITHVVRSPIHETVLLSTHCIIRVSYTMEALFFKGHDHTISCILTGEYTGCPV